MIHPHFASAPIDQEVFYPYHIPPIPWELSSPYTLHSLCTFPSDHVESQVQPSDLDTNYFHELPKGVQHKNGLDRYEYAYNALIYSFWVDLFFYHKPC